MAHYENMKKMDLFKRTIPYIKKEKKLVITTIILSFIVSGLMALTPFITKAIIDNYLKQGLYDKIISSLIIYGIIVFITAICRYLFQYINTLTGMHIEKRIREEAIRKIAGGTSGSMKNISKPGLLSIPVKKVSFEMQNELAAFVAQIDKSKSVIQKSLDETQLLFDSLMQQYFG